MHAGLLLTPPVRHWHCPVCGRTSTTTEIEPHAQLHPCPRTRGLLTPYVPGEAPTGQQRKGKVVVLERQDYERHGGLVAAGRAYTEDLRRDDAGQPVMGVSVEYDGGAATALFVPGILIKARLV